MGRFTALLRFLSSCSKKKKRITNLLIILKILKLTLQKNMKSNDNYKIDNMPQ